MRQVWLNIVAAAGAAGLAGQVPAAIAVTETARALHPGELVVLTVTLDRPADGLRVHAFERDWAAVATGPGEWQVLVGLDLDVTPGAHAVAIDARRVAAPARHVHTLNVRARQFPTRRLTVDDAFVNPPAAAQARIAAEAAELARLWNASADTRLWTGGFVAPVPHPATSAFGSRSIFNGQPRSPHSGADFPSPAGTPVRAPNGGRVALARDLYYTGGTVVLDHGLGLFSLFAHLRTIRVPEGSSVSTGDEVGEVGATGRVTGAHLHWTVRLNGARVDPLSLLAVLGGAAAPLAPSR